MPQLARNRPAHSGALRDEMLRLDARLRERDPVPLDRALERDDLVEHVRVERGDLIRGIDAREDVVEIRCAEDHFERRGLRARVERDEPLRDQLLAALEIALRDLQLVAVDDEVVLHLRELDVCQVEALISPAEARVKRLHLREDARGLRPFRRDRRLGGRGSRREKRREESKEHVRRRSPSPADDGSLIGNRTAHREGPVRHEWGRLAICSDTGNRQTRAEPSEGLQNLPLAALYRRYACGTVLRVLGQAHPPLARLLGIAVAVFLVVVLPAIGEPNPIGSATGLRLENAQLAAKSRSAVLSLYSLDSQLAAARSRLSTVREQLRALRTERATLRRELNVARAGEQISERQLATRLRQLYDQGEVSPIEVVFGATSITDAMTQLDNIHRVASLNDEVLAQLRAAHTRLVTTAQQLSARTADLNAALRTAAATEASLARTRAARASYIASLSSRRNLNSAQIVRLDRRREQRRPSPSS